MSPMELALQSRPEAQPATSEIHGPPGAEILECTLLELVEAVGDVTEDEAEVVATVLHLLRSGRVRLCGNFRDVPIATFLG